MPLLKNIVAWVCFLTNTSLLFVGCNEEVQVEQKTLSKTLSTNDSTLNHLDSIMEIIDTTIKINIDKGGKISWRVTNEHNNTKFEIEEFRWDKWEIIGEVIGKGIGNHAYTILADTSCGIYQIRVRVRDNEKNNYCSKTIQYPIQKEVHFIGCWGDQRLSTKTRFEVCDSTGKVLLSGCSNIIETSKLPTGVYYLYYGNSIAEFFRK